MIPSKIETCRHRVVDGKPAPVTRHLRPHGPDEGGQYCVNLTLHRRLMLAPVAVIGRPDLHDLPHVLMPSSMSVFALSTRMPFRFRCASSVASSVGSSGGT